MRNSWFRPLIVALTSAARHRRALLPALAVVALLPLAGRATFAPAVAAAEPQSPPKVQTQPSSRRAGPLPPPFVAAPFADEFVITGAEQGEPGESYVPAGGDGTFGSPSSIFGLNIVDGVDVADVDGDGDLDFLIAEGTSGDVFLYRNLGQGSFAPERVADGVSTEYSTNLRIADFNGDGLEDFVVGDLRTTRGTKVYLQTRAGKFKVSRVLDTSWNDAPQGDEGPFLLGLTAGDLNGDGLVDIAMLGYEGEGAGEVRVYLGTGRGRFSAPVLLFNLEADFGFNLNATGLAAFDLEGDGDLDVIVGAGDGNHYVYVNDGGGAFMMPPGPAFVLAGQSGIDAYDADHDGDHDLVLVTIATTELFYVENLGGTFAAPVAVATLTGYGVAVGAPPIALTASQAAR